MGYGRWNFPFKPGQEISGRQARNLFVAPGGPVAAWHRPKLFRGRAACDFCRGIGWRLTTTPAAGVGRSILGEVPCGLCDGTGDMKVRRQKLQEAAADRVPAEPIHPVVANVPKLREWKCSTCKGSGSIVQWSPSGTNRYTCRVCKGRGTSNGPLLL